MAGPNPSEAGSESGTHDDTVTHAARRGEVLIVDDTPANLQLLTSLLKERGYKGRPVTGGALALRAAKARPPDVILLDVNMPEMDGYEVCRRLKQDPELCDIPVLFISALSEPLDKVSAFRAGGVDFVTKPFDIQEVQARIDTHVRLRQAQLELEEKNRALEASYRKLREMEGLRDTLSHMIAHDMRSPLTGIMAALQFLRSDLGDQLPRESVEDIERGIDSVHQLVRMVNDLLDVSRLEAGKMPVELQRCELTTLCRQALELLGAHGKGRDVEVADLGSCGPVECDEGLIRRVLLNLLHNALKFTPARGKVRVSCVETNGRVRIAIHDDGPGVPEDLKKRIFDKFEQARLHQQQRINSTGLGLAFCRLAVEAHHGAIGVESERGNGSTFWFELPQQRGTA